MPADVVLGQVGEDREPQPRQDEDHRRGLTSAKDGLAVEVLSPTDRAGDIAHKVAEYLSVGARLLWVVDVETASGVVYRPGAPPRTVRAPGALDGQDVLPGFSCPLAALFG
jgi:Uma2 family endonuclease